MRSVEIQAPDAAALESPFVGLSSYTERNAPLFFGRDAERKVLISNLRASRLTLLYAQSGTGKTSLLHAGVASRLRELAHRSREERGTARNIPVLFDGWQDEPTDGLIDRIEAAIGPFLAFTPAALPRGRLEDALQAASEASNATLLVILDQFEEYFVYRSTEERPLSFADELAACINRPDLRANFLIAIREDAYAGLGSLFRGRMNNVYRNYLQLQNLNHESAREAIEKPIMRINELHPERDPVEPEPALVDAVLRQLSRPDQFAPAQIGVGFDGATEPARAGDQIAAPYLQLVMKRLWDVEVSQGSNRLRLATLRQLGDAQEIVKGHLNQALGELDATDRAIGWDMFNLLVTPSGTKIAHSAFDLAEYTGHPVDRVKALLERLSRDDTRILTPVPPPPGTDFKLEARYEISHDLLGPVIRDWRRGQWHEAVERQAGIRAEAVVRQARTEAEEARSEADEARRQAQKQTRRAENRTLVAVGVGLIFSYEGPTVLFWLSYVGLWVLAVMAAQEFRARSAEENQQHRQSRSRPRSLRLMAFLFAPAILVVVGTVMVMVSDLLESDHLATFGVEYLLGGAVIVITVVTWWPGESAAERDLLVMRAALTLILAGQTFPVSNGSLPPELWLAIDGSVIAAVGAIASVWSLAGHTDVPAERRPLSSFDVFGQRIEINRGDIGVVLGCSFLFASLFLPGTSPRNGFLGEGAWLEPSKHYALVVTSFCVGIAWYAISRPQSRHKRAVAAILATFVIGVVTPHWFGAYESLPAGAYAVIASAIAMALATTGLRAVMRRRRDGRAPA